MHICLASACPPLLESCGEGRRPRQLDRRMVVLQVLFLLEKAVTVCSHLFLQMELERFAKQASRLPSD